MQKFAPKIICLSLVLFALIAGCSDDNDNADSGKTDGDMETGETDKADDSDGDLEIVETDGDSDSGESVDGDEDSDLEQEGGLPSSLAFHIEREPDGEPLSEDEIKETTKIITGFWKDTAYFDWIAQTSHGMAADNQWGYPDYKYWWQNTVAVKEGDLVTFKHTGGADNILLRTVRPLMYSLAGYKETGDARLRRICIDYLRGIRAMYTGMIWGDEDPVVDTVMARGIFNHNHEYVLEGDRRAAVDYEPVCFEDLARRHDTLHNPDNPTWGDIWVRTKRSKDDVPFLYRLVPLMMRIIEDGKDATDEEFVNEVEETMGYIQRFTKDIVDHGYMIRTKDAEGNAYIPLYNDYPDDYASYVNYEKLWPNAECAAKLSSALVAYKETLDNECGDGYGGGYEEMTIASHYWSTIIINYFHISAVASALIEGRNDIAEELVQGLADRAVKTMQDEEGRSNTAEWNSDLAVFLLVSASYGLPLTATEARMVSSEFKRTLEHYSKFELWDLWDESVPDGEYEYIPDREMEGEAEFGQTKVIRPTELAAVIEYCESPFKDPTTEPFIDCSVVLDPESWGK